VTRKYKRWDPEEVAAIEAELDRWDKLGSQPGFAYVASMRERHPALFEDYSDQKIRNMFNALKKVRKGLCHCGHRPPEPGSTRCAECKAKVRERRMERVVEGVCARCGEPIDTKGSMTQCSSCLGKMRKRYYRPARNQAKERTAWWRGVSYNLFKWIVPGTATFALDVLRQSPDHLLVDLFGGSGDLTVRALLSGCEVLAYNDVHPGLVAFMRVMDKGLWPEMWDEVKALRKEHPDRVLATYHTCLGSPVSTDEDLVKLGALLYTVARQVEGRGLVAPRMMSEWQPLPPRQGPKMRRFHRALKEGEVQISCLDFAEAIDYHDCYQALFIADPPWPGTRKYEYTVDGRYGELVEKLLATRGRFVLTMASTRESLDAMLPCPHLYYLLSYGGARLLVGSDFPLKSKRLLPFDAKRFDPGRAKRGRRF